MCGFAGFLAGNDISKNVVQSMTSVLEHRGPDSHGIWLDADASISLGHRRLSIVDLTAAGHQPMASAGGRYVITFNGEIYNHLELREELSEGGFFTSSWRSYSDTETLLAGFEIWGVEATLKKSIGMFAFAVWDRELKQLVLARDRLGEKPLYYGWQGKGGYRAFLFGSELSALKQHPSFEGEISRNALACYMRYGCIGGEYSIYEGIYKLLPGHTLTISLSSPHPILKSWWSLGDVILRGFEQPFAGSPEDAVNALDLLLRDAVSKQMMADVPLGAFLSGGIDSSTIATLMQNQSSSAIQTFTIGFEERGYNEAEHAKAVAQHLGTKHTELYVTSSEAQAVIPKLPFLYSEPFADVSQIPTFLISQLARQHVTVAISGDAGDELFCGYRRYQMTAAMWGRISALPKSLRRALSGILGSASVEALNDIGNIFSVARLGEKVHKGADVIGCETIQEVYRGLVSSWDDPASLVIGSIESSSALGGVELPFEAMESVEQMMAMDMLTYLPDDILTKVDRAAMGVSLETRTPLLDPRVVDFAWSLPLDYKLRNGVTKWPLRQVLYRYVPRELIERPKMGFGVPIGEWLRGPLRDWAEMLLSESRLRAEGYLRPEPIRKKWAEHLSGKRNWHGQLWNVLMFQAWLEANRNT